VAAGHEHPGHAGWANGNGGDALVYLLNSPVIDPAVTPITIRIDEVTTDHARTILAAGFESAVGHEASARFLSNLLGLAVSCERRAVRIRPGDSAIALKLDGRPPEGAVLTEEQLSAIPYRLLWIEAQVT
jgi:hypothetical protein